MKYGTVKPELGQSLSQQTRAEMYWYLYRNDSQTTGKVNTQIDHLLWKIIASAKTKFWI